MQSGTGTYRTFAESRLMHPDPAPDLQTGPVRGPSRGEAPHPGIKRHAVAGCTCRLKPERRSPSGSCLQSPDDCDGRRGDIRRSQPSPCPSRPTSARKASARPSGCRKSSLMSVPTGIRTELAPPSVAGYKLYLSGGFLSGAPGSAEVQNVLFAGVFVPQAWNTTCHRSASRICPVGCRHRPCHAAPVPDAAFCSSCKVLYTSMTSPKAAKSPCHERRGARCPTLGALPHALPTAKLDYVQDADPGMQGFIHEPPYRGLPRPICGNHAGLNGRLSVRQAMCCRRGGTNREEVDTTCKMRGNEPGAGDPVAKVLI